MALATAIKKKFEPVCYLSGNSIINVAKVRTNGRREEGELTSRGSDEKALRLSRDIKHYYTQRYNRL